MSPRLSLFCLTLCLICAVTISIRVTRFTYRGCFVDSQNNVRDLRGFYGITQLGNRTIDNNLAVNDGQATTIERCSLICSIGSFKYMGLQSNAFCHCADSAMNQGAASESDCGSPCLGNSSQKCGGAHRNSIYELTYPNTDVFIPEPVTYVTVNTAIFTQPLYWTVSASYLLTCLSNCNAGCEGVIFSQQQSLCHLLKFASVPSAMVNTAGDFFVRN